MTRRVVAGPRRRRSGPRGSRTPRVAGRPARRRHRVPSASALARLERLNRIDGLSVFTLFDGQLVGGGNAGGERQDGSAPRHGGRSARRARRSPPRAADRSSRSVPTWRAGIAAIVKESLAPAGRGALRGRAVGQGRGARLDADRARLRGGRSCRRRRRVPALPARAGPGGRDPHGRRCLHRSGGRDLRRVRGRRRDGGQPRRAGPSGLDALARAVPAGRASSACRPAARTRGRARPTCCCRGWWPASRQPGGRWRASAHGGLLNREMRFRFPPYARLLEAPDG